MRTYRWSQAVAGVVLALALVSRCSDPPAGCPEGWEVLDANGVPICGMPGGSGAGGADGTVDVNAAADETAGELVIGSGVKEPCPKGADCPCKDDTECNSGQCAADGQSATGKACARLCSAGCPGSYICKPKEQKGGENIDICVHPDATLCNPCTGDDECAHLGAKDAKCIVLDNDGRFCSRPCLNDAQCPTPGYRCKLSDQLTGGKGLFCRPWVDDAPAQCACSPSAGGQELATGCTVVTYDKKNPVAACQGKRKCSKGTSVLGVCEAPDPALEECNGKDDDCDGKTDEGTCDDGVACTVDSCGGVSGVCDNVPDPMPCAAAAAPCLQPVCDKKVGCSTTSKPDGAACDDGNPCLQGDSCAGGSCVGGKVAKNCDDANPCTFDLCAVVGGCQAKPASGPCSDDNPCTVAETCDLGQCVGVQKCDDGNPCTNDGCADGQCSATAATGGTCDDGDFCTTKDSCKAGKCVGGAQDPKCECLDALDCAMKLNVNPCEVVAWCAKDSTLGQSECKSTPKKVSCPAASDPVCTKNSCIAVTGTNSWQCATVPINEGGPCDDGKAFTAGDVCDKGVCTSGEKVNKCSNTADCAKYEKGNLCNGTLFCNKATQTCQINPATVVACPTVDNTLCRESICEWKTGVCKLTPINMLKACDDGDPCTQGEACSTAGVCSATDKAKPCECTADADCAKLEDNDLCNGTLYCNLATKKCAINPTTVVKCPAGLDTACMYNLCDKLTGKCSNKPVNEGAKCDADGNDCTEFDHCEGGKCVPGTEVGACQCENNAWCAKFEDGNTCNGSLVCDLVAKKCIINPNTVTVCPNNLDGPCLHNTCNPVDGKCAMKALPEGVACSDDVSCTVGDACKQGSCVAGPNDCGCKSDAECADNDGNLCTKAVCLAKACTLVADTGLACDDNNACTVGEACDAGATCAPASSVNCDDSNPCTKDACDLKAGCSHAQQDGVACSDGKVCTAADVCADGACKAGQPLNCNDGNVCTDEVCSEPKGCVNLANAATCSDGNACTQGDACAALWCEAGKTVSCDDGNACTADACELAKGCTATAVKDGGACEDSTACTVGDTCDGGKCVAGQAVPFQVTLGGAKDDEFSDLVVVPDGYVLAGRTKTTGAGDWDAWIVATSAAGDKLWEKTYGGPSQDWASLVVAVPDGFAFAGIAHSTGPVTGDFWLVRIDAKGSKLWDKSFGSDGKDQANGLAALSNGFAVAGHTGAGGGKPADGMLVRTDGAGNTLWSRTYGGPKDEDIRAVAAVGGGFILAGDTSSKGAGSADFWLVRTNANGVALWERTYGQAGYDSCTAVAVLQDGFVLAGVRSPAGQPSVEARVVRTDSAGNALWEKSVGGAFATYAYQIKVLPDGFALGGMANANSTEIGAGDVWLARTDLLGNLHWQRTFGGAGYDFATRLAVLPDGFALAGGNDSKVAGDTDGWLVRTDAFGNLTCTGAGACAAKTGKDCDDGKPCTADNCEDGKGCASKPLTDGDPCADGDACHGPDTCKDGACEAGKLDTLWNKAVAKPASENVIALVTLPDGQVALVGTTQSADLDGLLRKVDAHGAVKPFLATGAESVGAIGAGEFFNDATWSVGGNSLVAVGDAEVPNKQNDGWIARFSADGKQAGSDVKVGGSGNDHLLAAVATTDGGVAIAGYSSSFGGKNDDGWLVQIDSTGKLLKPDGITVGDKGDSYQAFTAIGELRNGDLLLAGATDLGTKGCTRLWLHRRTATGGVVFERSDTGIWVNGAGIGIGARHVVAVDDGFVVAVTLPADCKTWSYHPAADTVIARFSGDGQLLWQRNHGKANLNDGVLDLARTGDLLIASGWSGPGGNRAGRLIGVDLSGNAHWARDIGGSEKAELWAVQPLAGGNVLVAGQSTTTSDIYLARVDAWGQVDCGVGGCVGKEAGDCADGKPCTVDGCSATTGQCSAQAMLGASPCDDGEPCTVGEICATAKCANGGAAAFDTTYGGAKDDWFDAVVALPDGLLLGGTTDVGGGNFDAWLVRRSTQGVDLWSKSFGGGGHDEVYCVAPTPDGGFVVSGLTNSSNLPDGKKTHGDFDVWLFKVDGNGKMLWNQTIGGSSADQGCAIATADGGIALSGSTNSTDLASGKKPAGGYDVWLLKLDKDGAVQWDQLFGGGDSDLASSNRNLVQLSDGGFAISAWTASGSTPGGGGSAGGQDFWLIRTDSAGGLKWAKTYGGIANDRADGFAALADGGFALIGYTYSATLPQDQKSLQDDVWVVRTDSNGKMLWNRAYGGTGEDWGAAIVEMAGGDLAWVARTGSLDLPSGQKLAGSNDVWVTRTGPTGAPLWSRTLGGAELDLAFGLARTLTDGLSVVGLTASQGSGAKDGWLLRLDPWGNPTCTACAGLTPFDCDDANPKTLDLCDPAKGCVHLPR